MGKTVAFAENVSYSYFSTSTAINTGITGILLGSITMSVESISSGSGDGQTNSHGGGSSRHRRNSSRASTTGFPESFAERTTSMRHPDAITGPDACISAEDVDPAKVLMRSRHRSHSLMNHKHRRTISHGMIEDEGRRLDGRHSVINGLQKSTTIMSSYDVCNKGDSAIGLIDEKGGARADIDNTHRPSTQDGGESLALTEHSPSSPTSPSSSQHNSSPKRMGFLRKWREHHKHRD